VTRTFSSQIPPAAVASQLFTHAISEAVKLLPWGIWVPHSGEGPSLSKRNPVVGAALSTKTLLTVPQCAGTSKRRLAASGDVKSREPLIKLAEWQAPHFGTINS
jgi:hypothetical protein